MIEESKIQNRKPKIVKVIAPNVLERANQVIRLCMSRHSEGVTRIRE
jgi:hypothetical protein